MVFLRDRSYSELDAHLGNHGAPLYGRLLPVFYSIFPGESLQLIFSFAYYINDPGPTCRAFLLVFFLTPTFTNSTLRYTCTGL